MKWLNDLPWALVLAGGGLLALAPFVPEPHLWEKLRMLASGTLTRPLDIFDLLMHGSGLVLIALKAAAGRS
jgi:hypothetical protein